MLELSVLSQQLAHSGGNVRLGCGELGQPALAILRGQIECLIEIGGNTLPLPGLGRR
jgi:hypothetical protein